MICYNKTHDKVYVEQMLESSPLESIDNKLVLSSTLAGVTMTLLLHARSRIRSK